MALQFYDPRQVQTDITGLPITIDPLTGMPQGQNYQFYSPADRQAAAQNMAEETLLEQAKRYGGKAKDAAKKAGSQAQKAAATYGPQAGKLFQPGALFPRGALLGGALAGIPTALTEAQEGRPVGAIGAVAGSTTGSLLGATAARFVPGRLGAVARVAAPIIGGMIGAPTGAQATEYAKRKITKEPTKGKEAELGSQLAAAEQMAELELRMRTNAMNADTQNIIALSQAMSNQGFLDMQRYQPLIEKAKNNELVRNQAMVNTMGSQYARLGTLATAGKLATGAQAETGATVRTALTSNPYAANVLQAPSISFG